MFCDRATEDKHFGADNSILYDRAVEAERQWMQTLHSTESRELTEADSVSWDAYHAAQ